LLDGRSQPAAATATAAEVPPVHLLHSLYWLASLLRCISCHSPCSKVAALLQCLTLTLLGEQAN
jgi:hypothetical protein